MYVPTYYYSVALLLLGAVILRASRQATTLSAECPGTETSRGWLATSGGGRQRHQSHAIRLSVDLGNACEIERGNKIAMSVLEDVPSTRRFFTPSGRMLVLLGVKQPVP